MASEDAKVQADTHKQYHIKYSAYDKDSEHRSMIGSIFMDFPQTSKAIQKRIKEHIKERDGGVKNQIIIIDSISVIELSKS